MLFPSYIVTYTPPWQHSLHQNLLKGMSTGHMTGHQNQNKPPAGPPVHFWSLSGETSLVNGNVFTNLPWRPTDIFLNSWSRIQKVKTSVAETFVGCPPNFPRPQWRHKQVNIFSWSSIACESLSLGFWPESSKQRVELQIPIKTETQVYVLSS
jgi:hypothetical protein